MPAFTFEKISPPAKLKADGQNSTPVRRGALVRFLDRLTSARLQKSEKDIRKTQKPKAKYRKQR
jgi:hypothetical protein